MCLFKHIDDNKKLEMGLDLTLEVIAEIDRKLFLERWRKKILNSFTEVKKMYLPQVQIWLATVNQQLLLNMFTLAGDEFGLEVNEWSDELNLLIDALDQITREVRFFDYFNYIVCEILLNNSELCPEVEDVILGKQKIKFVLLCLNVRGGDEGLEIDYKEISDRSEKMKQYYSDKVEVLTALRNS